jgi:hypothetical protein
MQFTGNALCATSYSIRIHASDKTYGAGVKLGWERATTMQPREAKINSLVTPTGTYVYG